MPRAMFTSITKSSRRDVLGAIGFTGLAAVAAVGIAEPDQVATSTPTINPDAALLTACNAFAAAHRDQEADNARHDGDEAETTRVSKNWYDAVAGITAAPRPQTPAGRVALARAAHVALVDQITGCGTDLVDETATAEEALALAALDAMQSAAA